MASKRSSSTRTFPALPTGPLRWACLLVGLLTFLPLSGRAEPPAASSQMTEKFRAAETGGVPGEYIVLLADDVSRSPYEAHMSLPSVPELAELLAEAYQVQIVRVWEHALQGFHIRATELDAQRLASDPLVGLVSQDRRVVSFRAFPPGCYSSQNQADDPAPEEGELATRIHAIQTVNCDDPDPRNSNRDCTENWGIDRIDQTSGTRNEQYVYNSLNTGTGVCLAPQLGETGIG